MNETPCRHFEDDLSTWMFEGALDEKRLAPLKGHLKTCSSCRQLKDDYSAMKQGLGEETLKAPPELKSRVLQRIAVGSSPRRSWVGPLSYAAAASVMAVMFWGLSTGELFHRPQLALENQRRLGSAPSERHDRSMLKKDGESAPSKMDGTGRKGYVHDLDGKSTKTSELSDENDSQWNAPTQALQSDTAPGDASTEKESGEGMAGDPTGGVLSGDPEETPTLTLTLGLKFKVLKKDLPMLDKALKDLSLHRKPLVMPTDKRLEDIPSLPTWIPPGQHPPQSSEGQADLWEYVELVAP
ncbi:MAG: anti-sigma factor [Planctomycetota bacterium]